jgi:hypothetical protein
MAKAFPKSTFVGFDYHEASIQAARARARDAGVGDRVRFEVARSTDFPGTGYDLVAHFDCLHDMEDPVGAAKQAKQSLAADGTWMIVEPFASDRPRRPTSSDESIRVDDAVRPHSLSRRVALGAQVGEARGKSSSRRGFDRAAPPKPSSTVLGHDPIPERQQH